MRCHMIDKFILLYSEWLTSKHMDHYMRFWYLSHMRKKPPLNAHGGVSQASRARCLNFGQSLYLHPYFEYASSRGSGESVHLCRLA